MKALVLNGKGEDPVIAQREITEPERGQVRVRLEAAALNRRDVWIKRGQYPGIRYPIILGSDGCGVVESAGEGADDWVGRRVILYPGFDWGEDERCQAANYRILGLPDDGTFAESIIVPVENLCCAPAHLSSPEAGALPLAGVTAWRALMTRGRLSPGASVFVSGVGGGVALFAVQFAVAHGANVAVSSSDQTKIQRAVALGAVGGVLYTQDTWLAEAKALSPHGFDVIIDGAGGKGFGGLTRLLAPAGRLVFYGGTHGKWPEILPQHLFFRQIDILASTMGSPREFTAMTEFVNRHTLKPVVDRVFPLHEGASAFDHLESGRQFGKVVISI